MIHSLFPIGAEDLTPTKAVKDFPIGNQLTDFKPTVAYNSLSSQGINDIVFFEQKTPGKESGKWRLRAQAYSINENEFSNKTPADVDYMSPNLDVDSRRKPVIPRKGSTIRSIAYIPEAILQLERNISVVGLYGIELDSRRTDPNYRNGSIILLRDSQTLLYCVTPEDALSDDVSHESNH